MSTLTYGQAETVKEWYRSGQLGSSSKGAEAEEAAPVALEEALARKPAARKGKKKSETGEGAGGPEGPADHGETSTAVAELPPPPPPVAEAPPTVVRLTPQVIPAPSAPAPQPSVESPKVAAEAATAAPAAAKPPSAAGTRVQKVDNWRTQALRPTVTVQCRMNTT